MNKHTPGPWYVAQSGTRIYSSGYNGIVAQCPKDFPYVNGDGGRDYRKKECVVKANARLVAAAPDLLEALQQLVIRLPRTWIDVANVQEKKMRERAIRDASSAIAKAKGEVQ